MQLRVGDGIERGEPEELVGRGRRDLAEHLPASSPVSAAKDRAVAPWLARRSGHTPTSYAGADSSSGCPSASSTAARAGNSVTMASRSPEPKLGLMTLGAQSTFQLSSTRRRPNVPW